MYFHELIELTPAQDNFLRRQTIDDRQPGTILRDFNTLLDFVGPDGIPVTGGYLLPLKLLKPLNERLSRPIELGLKRPQQKSYPHLNGLYLLLRASGLSQIDATENKPRLTLDRTVLQSWGSLNPTEQYLTLLETWVLRAEASVIGERGGGFFRELQLQNALSFFNRIPAQGQQIAGDPETAYSLRYFPGLYNVGLLELFGFIEVQHNPPVDGEGWQIGRISRTPLGEAMLALLGNYVNKHFDEIVLAQDELSEIPFGILQPALQPYFPAWQRNLTFPEEGFQAGVFIFKVSLGKKIWRRIAIPADLTLAALGTSILNSVQFDHDHLDCFTYTNRFGTPRRIYHPFMDDPPHTDEVQIGELPLKPGATMEYLFDFGDNWTFEVTLERIEPVDPSLTEPKLLEQHGESPDQYGYW